MSNVGFLRSTKKKLHISTLMRKRVLRETQAPRAEKKNTSAREFINATLGNIHGAKVAPYGHVQTRVYFSIVGRAFEKEMVQFIAKKIHVPLGGSSCRPSVLFSAPQPAPRLRPTARFRRGCRVAGCAQVETPKEELTELHRRDVTQRVGRLFHEAARRNLPSYRGRHSARPRSS